MKGHIQTQERFKLSESWIITGKTEDIRKANKLRNNDEAFIYLSLKATSNLSVGQFHSVITNGPDDGGIDAIYIDRAGANILVTDFGENIEAFKSRFAKGKLKKMTATMKKIITSEITRDEINSRLWNAFGKLKEYWNSIEGNYIPHNFFFCTNKLNPKLSHRKKLERQLNYYMKHDYYYLNSNSLRCLLLLRDKFANPGQDRQ
jgi:hypothetical protein